MYRLEFRSVTFFTVFKMRRVNTVLERDSCTQGSSYSELSFSKVFNAIRGGASPEKMGWKRDRIDGQKVYLTIFMSFLLRNEC